MDTPVLLSDGSGIGLWPGSYKARTNNIVEFLGDEYLFQTSAWWAESHDLDAIGLELKDIVLVQTNCAALLADRCLSEVLKLAINASKERGAKTDVAPLKDHRHRDLFEILAVRPSNHDRCIYVQPDPTLALQSHLHLSEHRIALEGVSKVNIRATTGLAGENEPRCITQRAMHRMEDLRKVLIGRQTEWLGDEDNMGRYSNNCDCGQGIKG